MFKESGNYYDNLAEDQNAKEKEYEEKIAELKAKKELTAVEKTLLSMFEGCLQDLRADREELQNEPNRPANPPQEYGDFKKSFDEASQKAIDKTLGGKLSKG